jgi:hypothetical protein
LAWYDRQRGFCKDPEGRDIFVVQAQRDGKRFIVRGDKRLAAFRELESAIRSV